MGEACKRKLLGFNDKKVNFQSKWYYSLPIWGENLTSFAGFNIKDDMIYNGYTKQ